MSEPKKKDYEAPATQKTQVEMEEGIFVVASTDPATLKVDSTIEVEDYTEITNEVTFE